jgi:peptide/nickel transport system permease protein
MRIVDIFICLPTLPILLIASALIDALGVDVQYRIYWVMVILTVFGWSGIARLVRGQILSLREQEYMVAAETMGFSSARKIFSHLIPNVMPLLIVSMTMSLGGVILMESTLSYLGLGVPQPYAAWGTMIASAKQMEILEKYPFIWVPPGVVIVLVVLAFNFVGDGLRDAFDPKMRR